jgi:hypothetical protein
MTTTNKIFLASAIVGTVASVITIYEIFFGGSSSGSNNTAAKKQTAAAGTATKQAAAAINKTPSVANPGAAAPPPFSVATGAMPVTESDAEIVMLDPNATPAQISAAQAIESNMDLYGSANAQF